MPLNNHDMHSTKGDWEMTDKEKVEILRKALIDFIGSESKEDLDKIELIIRSTIAPDMDKAIAINAIDALRKTSS